MATAVSDRGEKELTKTRIGKQHTAEGFTTKASMKNVTVMISKCVVDDELLNVVALCLGCWSTKGRRLQRTTCETNFIQKIL